jgi:hypothetical protein
MLIGFTLLSGTTAHSTWQSSGGEKGVFGVDIQAIENSTTLTMTVQTKNIGELDSAAVTATGGTFSGLSTVDVTTQHVTGLKQLWRLKYEAQVGESSDEKFVHFRPLVPSFEQNGVLVPQMEPDLIGRTLVRGSSSITVQGPWSSSGGPKATFAADILDLPANVSFTVSIEHRDPGETEGDETEAGSLSVTSGARR